MLGHNLNFSYWPEARIGHSLPEDIRLLVWRSSTSRVSSAPTMATT